MVCLSTGQVQIGILRTGIAINTLSTVCYLNGNCMWRYNATYGPQQTTMDTTEGPALFLFSDAKRFTFQCEVYGSVKLSGYTTVNGES